MPRIPVRTTPYHTLPRCTRHYKSKRDLILRALGKASFINGSQFVIAWISPKGEVDVYASELLQSAVTAKDGGVLNRKELEREAGRCKGEMARRWEDIRRLEEKGEAPVMEDEADEGVEAGEGEVEGENEDEDGDRTLVDDGSSADLSGATLASLTSDDKKRMPFFSDANGLPTPSSGNGQLSATSMMSTFSANVNSSTTQANANGANATRQSTPSPPMHTLTLAPDAIENYYTSRFAALQQATCKLVVKAWIKVIEPKKQMKFPYNKGEELKPTWWPEGVRHREPDHLSKTERLTLLSAIVRSPLITVSRLELSTAEAAAFISRPRLAILREVYLVAKEEEKRRLANDTSSELIVHLPNLPVSPTATSPEAAPAYDPSLAMPQGKRAFDATGMDKENIIAYANQQHVQQQAQQQQQQQQQQPQSKRLKSSHHTSARLAPLAPSHINTNFYDQPFTYAAHVHPAHLSPYPGEMYPTGSASGSEYGRSPNPDHAHAPDNRPFSAHPAHPHLAPLLNHHAHAQASPIDSPAFPQTATLAPPAMQYYARSPSANGGANGQATSYMQQQQLDYLHAHAHGQAQQHPGYDYGSPYLADPTWEAQYAQAA